MNDFVEMEVAIVEGLEDEVSVLVDQIKTLADFLMANFKGEVSPEDDIFGAGATRIAVRLLGELKARRELAAALAEINRLEKADGCKVYREPPRPWVATWPKGEPQYDYQGMPALRKQQN